MDPVAFTLGPFNVRWYGIFVVSGIVLGFLYVIWQGKKWGYDSEDIIDFLLYGLPIGLVGTRGYYVLFNIDYFRHNPLRVFDISGGGLAIHGAIFVGLAYTVFFVRWKKYSFLEFADLLTPAFLLGLAVGRWGNFANQEAHGGEVSYEFISYFPRFIQQGMEIGGTYYHPTFLYEFFANLIIFVILIFFIRSKLYTRGRVLALGLGLYSFVRFIIEDLRLDSLYLGDIQIARLVSIFIIIFCMFLFIYVKDHRGVSNQ